GLLAVQQPLDGMATGVAVWWNVLCAVSLLNIMAWGLSAKALSRRMAETDPELYRFQRRQLVLSAIFVLGCAFRAVMPRADVQRMGLFDTWVSSVLVGRTVATIAELCFAAQWALWLGQTARDADSRLGLAMARLVFPLIVVAEICSWYAILTTAYLG